MVSAVEEYDQTKSTGNQRAQAFKSYKPDYMHDAFLQASLSECLAGQVGCVVVVRDIFRSVARGFNRPLQGSPTCREVGECLMRFDGVKDRCVRTVHAEAAAMQDAYRRGWNLVGSVWYCTKMPCINCAKLIADLGGERVYYVSVNTVLPTISMDIFPTLELIQVERPR